MYNGLIVKFGELFTKGKNRKDFIISLKNNVKFFLRNYQKLTYDIFHDHIYINLNGEDYLSIINVLKNISGIYSISPVIKIKNFDLEVINTKVLLFIKKIKKRNKTFKIFCKRNNKKINFNSIDIINYIAPNIIKTNKLKVDVHFPDIKLLIEIYNDGVFISAEKFLAIGGYPVGTNGKILMLISGGIDSPVASYLLIKKGVVLDFLHFSSPPYTSEAVIDKIKDILKELNRFQYTIKLHIVNFTEIQTKIYEIFDQSYAITVMRRMMYRIAIKLTKKLNCLAVANGDSIGQVSSQTIYSMNIIEEVNKKKISIIRPLSAFDKLDIIKIAKLINTYDISIRPYEDCCTIFSHKNSKIKPNLKKILLFEKKINYNQLINKAIKNLKTIVLQYQ